MVTFWENAAHFVYCRFSLYFDIVSLVISHLGFEGDNLILIVPVPDHCLSFIFLNHSNSYLAYTFMLK